MNMSTYGGGRYGPPLTSQPPRLENFSDEPRYDTSTVIQTLKVRLPVLVAWQQHLGFSSRHDTNGPNAENSRMYSERELVALKWLRDRVMSGAPLRESAAQLLAAQRVTAMPERSPSASRPLNPPNGMEPRTRSTSQPLPPQTYSTRPLTGDGWGVPSRGPSITRRLTETQDPAGSVPAQVAWVPGRNPVAAPNAAPAGGDISALVQPLVRAFGHFDTALAKQVLEEALAQRSLEMVCLRLLQPALARVGDLWSRSEMTIPEERFAVNFIQGFLYYEFYNLREPETGPLVLIACGPNELHEVSALMLALFWRRAGMRVAYLGQNIDPNSLIDALKAHRPALVAFSVSQPQRVRSLARLTKSIEQMAQPRPIVAYGGSVFVRNPELQKKVHGVYLGDDAGTATYHVRRLLRLAPDADR